MEIWAGDAGAYPVMGVIVGAAVFSLGYGSYYLATGPDARISKDKRKNLFRGDIKCADGQVA